MSSERTEAGAIPPETAAPDAFSLDTILNGDAETLEHPDFKDKPETGWNEETKQGELAEGYCIECEGESSTNCI
jgi:hypothetical protein